MNHFKEILAGIGIFLVAMACVVGVLGGLIYAGHANNQKVQDMNKLCVSKGYSGWVDDTGSMRCTR